MEKREKIKLLLQLTNMGRNVELGFRSLIEGMRDDTLPELKEIKEKFLTRFDAIFAEVIPKQVELFDSLLSEAAIDASIAFYSSPAGQEVVKTLPQINEGLSDLSMDLSASMAQELITELLKLEPSDDQMESMGFVKLPGHPDFEGSGYVKKYKFKKKLKFKADDNDDIDDDEFDRFANDWLK